MLGTLVLIAASMAAKDVFYNIATYLISKAHGWWAGVFDALGDIASLLSLGVGGVTAVQSGLLSLDTLEIFAALAVGSVTGGGLGTILGKKLSDHLDSPQHPISGGM